ncbi:hypothetical protein IRZ70_21680, partial [Pseudomonas monteilii]|nr:hypothetical protein [Pseudomonas monteilii]
ALHGTQLALLGGGMEVLGITLREGFKHASAPGFASSVLKSGVSLVSAGAIVSVVSGFFDAAQAGRASKRTFADGDYKSSTQYLFTTVSSAISSVAAFRAIFSPFILGPLGLAIAMSIAAYTFIRWATKNESTPLERWVKRCYFGTANESPVIHWNMPEQADLAFAELNAAILGLKVRLEFETRRPDTGTSSKIGGLTSLEFEQRIKFSIAFPEFNRERSGFLWKLIVHRHGDGEPYHYKGGEIITGDEYNSLTSSPAIADKLMLKPSYPQKFPDYKKDSIKFKYLDQKKKAGTQHAHSYRQTTGVIDLIFEYGKHNITAATLIVAYWPDKNIQEASAEIILHELNK